MSIFVFKHIFTATRPIRRINALLNESMKCRIRPITHTPDKAMFERVDVNIIHVHTKIHLIANQMFPITTLPYAPLAVCHANRGASFGFWQCLGKSYFDQSPSGCEVGIIGGEFDDAMQVVGQHHPTMDDEGMPLPYRSHRLAQQVHMPDQQVVTLPLQQIDSEEVSAARMPGATVIRHGDSIEGIFMRRNALRLLTPYALRGLLVRL